MGTQPLFTEGSRKVDVGCVSVSVLIPCDELLVDAKADAARQELRLDGRVPGRRQLPRERRTQLYQTHRAVGFHQAHDRRLGEGESGVRVGVGWG